MMKAALRRSGIGAVYGDPVDRLDVVPTPTTALAKLLADTHRAITGVTALVSVDGSLQRPDGSAVVLDEVASTDVVLELDESVIDAVHSAERAMVLAGPGVVSAGSVPGLHALAAAGRLGVINTWGAKGVFDWRSRHHLATAGLQARDFELGGLPESELVIATGIDPDEAPPALWSSRPHVVVEPAQLDALSEYVIQRGDWAPVPELRTRLAAVTQDGWADNGSPAAPSAITRNYGAIFGSGGRVAADPGQGGFWVARTFSTVELGSARVPGRAVPGFAAAAALVTRLTQPHRPILAVVDALSPETEAIIELADRLTAGFAIEVWSDAGKALTPEQHLDRLHDLAFVEQCEVVTLATAPWQLERIVDAAGPITAWGGLA